MTDPNTQQSGGDNEPYVPRFKSPIKWMGLMMGVLVVLTAFTMIGRDKVSIKATPNIPELNAQEQLGRTVMNAKCGECHGVDGTGGSKNGPPIVHPMYRESIYPDRQFRRVVREGRPEKNWQFGPMPAMGPEKLSDAELDAVIKFVRAVQFATDVK